MTHVSNSEITSMLAAGLEFHAIRGCVSGCKSVSRSMDTDLLPGNKAQSGLCKWCKGVL